MRSFAHLDDLANAVGEPLGESEWYQIDQAQIDLFADATGDHQWIHVDPERARSGPFGTTIAHGYLTLSLLARFLPELFEVGGVAMAVNYGLNKVRFPSPVPVGALVRATTELLAVDTIGAATQVTLRAVMHTDTSDKPACVAESVIRYFP